MTVDTKSVVGRRMVSYSSYADLIADADRLASGPVKTVGNWTYGQILQHLAISFNSSIDGIPFTAPIAFRFIARWFLKSRFLNKSLPSGYQVPDEARDHFVPAESADVQQSLEALKAAIERCQRETKRCKHALLGNLTLDEWEKFGLRHAEMHMSFAMPEPA